MSHRIALFSMLLTAVLCLGLSFGCTKTETAPEKGSGDGENGAAEEAVDPHDVPITDEQKEQMRQDTAKFADAVDVVTKLSDAVETETKDGIPANPFEAHQALDKLDIVTQWLPEIAKNSGVPKEDWATVTTAANNLREAFDTIHLNIDGKKDPDFAGQKQVIDDSIAQLKSVIPQ